MAVYIHSDIHGESSKPPPRSRSAAPPRFHPQKKNTHRCAEKFHPSQLGKKGSGWHAGESPGTQIAGKLLRQAPRSPLSTPETPSPRPTQGWRFKMAGRCRCTGAQVHSRHLIKAPKSFTKKAWSFLQVIYLVKCQSHHASQSLQLLPVEVSMEHATFKNLTSSQLTRNTPKTNERMYIYMIHPNVCTYMIYSELCYIYICVCVYVCIW